MWWHILWFLITTHFPMSWSSWIFTDRYVSTDYASACIDITTPDEDRMVSAY